MIMNLVSNVSFSEIKIDRVIVSTRRSLFGGGRVTSMNDNTELGVVTPTIAICRRPTQTFKIFGLENGAKALLPINCIR